MLRIIDTHAHLDELENLEEELAKARETGLAVKTTENAARLFEIRC